MSTETDILRDKLAEARHEEQRTQFNGLKISIDQALDAILHNANISHSVVMRKLTAPLDGYVCSSDDCGLVFYYALSGFNGEPPKFCPNCGAEAPKKNRSRELKEEEDVA